MALGFCAPTAQSAITCIIKNISVMHIPCINDLESDGGGDGRLFGFGRSWLVDEAYWLHLSVWTFFFFFLLLFKSLPPHPADEEMLGAFGSEPECVLSG